MIRRILWTGVGGIGGLVLWFFLLYPLIAHIGQDDGIHPSLVLLC